jgi:hypothetical protein
MVVHWLKSAGLITLAGSFFNSTSTPAADPSTVYALRWETMPENLDQPRPTVPAPTALMLYTFKDPNAATSLRPALGERQFFIGDNGIVIRKRKISLKGSWDRRDGEAVQVQILDCRGRLIFDETTRGTIDRRAPILPGPGVYGIKITGGGKSVLQGRIIVAP